MRYHVQSNVKAAVSSTATAWFASAMVSIFVVAFFVALSPDFWHYFALPVLLGGVVIGRDAFDWVRGRVDPLDPVGVLGIYGLHYFLLAPLLHVLWDFYWVYRFNPLDWRPWLAYMAWLNVFGLMIFRVARSRTLNSDRPLRTRWRLSRPAGRSAVGHGSGPGYRRSGSGIGMRHRSDTHGPGRYWHSLYRAG